MTEPLYRGEAILLNWNDNKSGRKIVLQIEKDGPGPHPFDGMDGERFAVVIVGPLASTEHTEIETTDGLGTRRKVNLKFTGDAPTREDGAADVASTKSAGAALSSSPAKPKKRWHEMPPSQRAALLVKDLEFHLYVTTIEKTPYDNTENDADAWLKRRCLIESKSELAPGTLAHAKFVDLEGDFMAWRQARQHGAA